MRSDVLPTINNYNYKGVDFVEITNNVGMVVTFANLGASIYSIKYLGELMTYQAKNLDDFLKENVYNGKSIGRVAGRIKDGVITIGKKTYKIEPNEGKNVLHGGKQGLSNQMFSQRVFYTTEHVHVVYTYFCDSRHSGFPGNALFEIHYIVSNNKPKLKIKLLSYVTEKSPISITNHTYLSLGEPNLNNAKLQIKASKTISMDPVDLILGEAVKLPSYMDFRKLKPIMKDINAKELNQGKLKGYDGFYLFDEKYDEIPKVIMENDKFKVEIFTDFDSTVIYTDNFDPHFEADNSKDKIRRGIAIEPQLNPTGNRYLSRGEEFDHFIRYEFAKK